MENETQEQIEAREAAERQAAENQAKNDHPAAEQQVTLKPSAIDPVAPVKDENVSDLPYHNKETEKIALDRAADVQADKPYEFKANGYTVTEVEGKDGLPMTYSVTAEGFERGFADKRDAEIYAETHARFIKA